MAVWPLRSVFCCVAVRLPSVSVVGRCGALPIAAGGGRPSLSVFETHRAASCGCERLESSSVLTTYTTRGTAVAVAVPAALAPTVQLGGRPSARRGALQAQRVSHDGAPPSSRWTRSPLAMRCGVWAACGWEGRGCGRGVSGGRSVLRDARRRGDAVDVDDALAARHFVVHVAQLR